MAIKATASITISRIVDIESVTRYYLLQSSTLAAPSKPTINPPSGSWVKTEPTYTSGSTNTLYFVDCTVFTNGSFSYSEVSKSSSYEAAKDAFNKATSVETRVTAAEASIEQNKEAIDLRVTKTEVTTMVDETASDLRETISDANKETLDSCANNIDKALENYVRTGDYTEYKETVSTQLEILANQIEMNFSTVSEEITSVNGETQAKFNELSKYIRYGVDGIEIGSTDSPLILTLDNDVISFTKNGEQIGWWDGVDFHTGNIVVDVQERAQFGNFAYVPRSDGSLMFLKVSG